MKVKIAWLAFGLVCIGGLGFLLCERNRYNIVSHQEIVSVREKLKALSPEERKDLSFFFNQVITFDQFSYTLVGYKPMSLSVVIVEETEDLPPYDRKAFKRPNHQAMRRGYLVWKKYQSLFPRKNFLLMDYSFLGQGRKEIIVMSPKLCREVIQDHLEDFQEILGRQYRCEEIFSILAHTEHNDFYTLIDHTRLIGILLGFGRNNAHLYEQYRGGASRSVTSNIRSEQDPLQMFSDEWPIPGFQLGPDFACDLKSEETLRLKNRYKIAQNNVRWTYFLRNDLEVTLTLLEH